MGYKLPESINPLDMHMLGDVIVNTPLIELRSLQEYLRVTYGVDLIIQTPVREDIPPQYIGYAASKGE